MSNYSRNLYVVELVYALTSPSQLRILRMFSMAKGVLIAVFDTAQDVHDNLYEKRDERREKTAPKFIFDRNRSVTRAPRLTSRDRRRRS